MWGHSDSPCYTAVLAGHRFAAAGTGSQDSADSQERQERAADSQNWVDKQERGGLLISALILARLRWNATRLTILTGIRLIWILSHKNIPAFCVLVKPLGQRESSTPHQSIDRPHLSSRYKAS